MPSVHCLINSVCCIQHLVESTSSKNYDETKEFLMTESTCSEQS